jgi:dinuclear metal center YbgI/SA1388 family protein
MEKLENITAFLDKSLNIASISDYCFNGLQVEGRREVKKIAFSVDSGEDVFNLALREKADMIVVHHGHFWSSVNPSIRGGFKRRLDILLKNGISLYACHLPLDVHPLFGNNISLLKLLGAKPKGPFAFHSGRPLSFYGSFPRPVKFDSLVKLADKQLETGSISLAFGNKIVRTIGVVSGAGSRHDFSQAAEAGLDVFLTGEPVDLFHDAKDLRMNVIFAGHHATEVPGMIALKQALAKKLSISTVFIDIPTGL